MKQITVLLADDNRVVRTEFRRILELEDDLEVVGEAKNGHLAVAMVKKLRPALVLMDVAMPLLNGLQATRQILKAAPANNNKVRAHGTGLTKLITVNLNPTGAMAMENSRHPITEAGLEILVKKIGSNLRRGCGRANSLPKTTASKRFMDGKPGRLKAFCRRIPSKGYYCYRCIVNLDVETKMPIKTQIFDWEDQLVECYGYEHLSLNPGLSDKDFDPKNPEYHF